LLEVPIDRYFWDAATQTATWAGPITEHATLGPLTTLTAATPIGNANILGAIRARKPVILRGRYTEPGGGADFHWMLATSYTVDPAGAVTALIANDPRTGRQLRIDPITKKVIDPTNATIATFRADAYRTVTLAP
jgi:hypothetical protein